MAGVLRQLINAWRGRDLLSDMLDEFQEMLTDGEWMFRTVDDVLLREKTPQSVHEQFFARDKKINRAEESIRRRIVESLSLRSETNVAACLVLMSVVKDAERIGDYCKNIYEVTCLYTMDFEFGPYIEVIKEMRTRIEGLFVKVEKAFRVADQEVAEDVIHETDSMGARCDQMIEELIHDDLPTPKAVAYTLLARYLKRIAGHLQNIATSVAGPVHQIDHARVVEARVRKSYGKET